MLRPEPSAIRPELSAIRPEPSAIRPEPYLVLLVPCPGLPEQTTDIGFYF